MYPPRGTFVRSAVTQRFRKNQPLETGHPGYKNNRLKHLNNFCFKVWTLKVLFGKFEGTVRMQSLLEAQKKISAVSLLVENGQFKVTVSCTLPHNLVRVDSIQGPH